MADEEDVFKAAISGVVQELAYIVAARNSIFRSNAPFFPAEVDAVVAEKSEDVTVSGSAAGIHFHVNRIDESLFAHRVYNSRGAQDG